MQLPETITVVVTREHLQQGEPNRLCHCAAALAIADELRRLGLSEWNVEVEAEDNVDINGARYEGDQALSELMGMFDNLSYWMKTGSEMPYGPVGPCTIELTRYAL
jgi:hypothetical protein